MFSFFCIFFFTSEKDVLKEMKMMNLLLQQSIVFKKDVYAQNKYQQFFISFPIYD